MGVDSPPPVKPQELPTPPTDKPASRTDQPGKHSSVTSGFDQYLSGSGKVAESSKAVSERSRKDPVESPKESSSNDSPPPGTIMVEAKVKKLNEQTGKLVVVAEVRETIPPSDQTGGGAGKPGGPGTHPEGSSAKPTENADSTDSKPGGLRTPDDRREPAGAGDGDADAQDQTKASGTSTVHSPLFRGRGVPGTDQGTARLDAPEKVLSSAKAELRAMRERAETANPRASLNRKAIWTFSVCKVVTPDGKVRASSEGAFYGGKARHAEQVALRKLDRSLIRPQDTVILLTEQFACQERCVPYLERWQKLVGSGLRVYSEATRLTQTLPDGTKEDVASGAKSAALKNGSRSEIIEDLSLRRPAAHADNQGVRAPRRAPVGTGRTHTPEPVPATTEPVDPAHRMRTSSAVEGLGMWLNQTQAKLSGEHEQSKLDAAVNTLQPQIDAARQAGKYVALHVTVDKPRVEDLGSAIFTTPNQLRYFVGVTMTTGDTRTEALDPPRAWEPGRPRDQMAGPIRYPPGPNDPRKWVTYHVLLEPTKR